MWAIKLIRALCVGLILSYMLVALVGCSSKIVYVSTPCNVQFPERPKFDNNTSKNIKQLLIYTETLEASLGACL